MDERPQTAPALRATTADRDRMIDRLTHAFVEGALDDKEFEKRVALAHTSLTRGELLELSRDLPPTDERAIVPAPRNAVVPAADVRQRGKVVSVFGNAGRKGHWMVPRETKVVTVFGNGEIDLREARLPTGVFELRVVAVFGNVEVIVPPHLALESEGVAVLGSFEHVDRAPAQPAPDAPTLRISGAAVFGNVEIETRLPGESAADARRRRRQERRGG